MKQIPEHLNEILSDSVMQVMSYAIGLMMARFDPEILRESLNLIIDNTIEFEKTEAFTKLSDSMNALKKEIRER